MELYLSELISYLPFGDFGLWFLLPFLLGEVLGLPKYNRWGYYKTLCYGLLGGFTAGCALCLLSGLWLEYVSCPGSNCGGSSLAFIIILPIFLGGATFVGYMVSWCINFHRSAVAEQTRILHQDKSD
jgi:hypothetical protein